MSVRRRPKSVIAAYGSPRFVAEYATNAFWQLLDLYREASNRRLNLCAARDYAYAVWKSAPAEHTAADT